MIEKEMNTKKVIRRALALILAAVIAVSLAACGGGKGSDSGSGSKPGKSGKTWYEQISVELTQRFHDERENQKGFWHIL